MKVGQAYVGEDGQWYYYTEKDVMMKEEYTVLDYEDGIKYRMTLEQILEEINRDRSPLWEEFDETDWREGLEEFTTMKVVEE